MRSAGGINENRKAAAEPDCPRPLLINFYFYNSFLKEMADSTYSIQTATREAYR